MEAKNIIISWWEKGSEEQSWTRTSPEAISEALKEIKEMYSLGYLRADPWGTYVTIANTKGVIIAKLKEENLNRPKRKEAKS